MTENFCHKHNTTFFMKGKMKGYAHPIKDDDGNDTGLWCNMADLPKPTEDEQKVIDQIHEQVGETGISEKPHVVKYIDDQTMKLRSMAVAYSKDCWVAGKIEKAELGTMADWFIKYIRHEEMK